jgi:UDPglucose 6-dehydrogenase
MKISIFGTGYVGLVTGACFAEMGNTVICADIDAKKIDLLKEGISPIYEPGIEDLILRNQKASRLTFTTDLKLSVTDSDILFIAVGTPPGEDGSADLSYVLSVARNIGQHMNDSKVIVNKSTVPVGTAKQVEDEVKKALNARGVTFEFEVVSNPEFLKEGTAIEDCLKPSRVIIGHTTENAKSIMQALYEPFVKNGHPIIFMDTTTAEMTKYAANAFLATKISFMNELSELCEKVGADIEKVRVGIGSDPRIGQAFIYPGLGYGGSCFPKDIKALIEESNLNHVTMKILNSVESVNLHQRQRFSNKVIRFAKEKGLTQIALWGLAFKPGTDDVREAPALDLIRDFLKHNLQVKAFDPVAISTAKQALRDLAKSVEFSENQYSCLEGSDLLVIATEWLCFREPDFGMIKSLLKTPTIFDGRNIYSLNTMRKLKFNYFSIGRESVICE